jgi:hypothetical protein
VKVASGKVIDGKVVVERTTLVEGTPVTVLVRENEETFQISAAQEAELLRAIAELDRGECVSSDQVLQDLRN